MRNKKGFTLIELLAVIVILGLLLIIAIPAVTKYINESRKKTYISNVNGYLSSATLSLNNLEYDLTDPKATYYLSIDCLNVEKGVKSPFGDWIDAYVVVGYNDVSNSYDYYWFGKDDGGYSVDLIKENDLNVESIKKNDEIIYKRELDNKYGNIYLLSKDNSCVAEKIKNETPIDKLPMLKAGALDTGTYSKDKIKTITFENKINIPQDIEAWDVSSTSNGKVMAYVLPNVIDDSYFDLFIQGDGRIYANPNSSRMFENFTYLDSINNIEILNTSRVTNMQFMFYSTGYHSQVFTLDLGSNFDTSNVTSIDRMFFYTGRLNKNFTLNLGDNFDTSKVGSMISMFYYTGASSTVFTLDLGDKFDTSNVTSMNSMFQLTGAASPIFRLYLGKKFNTEKVTNMNNMFLSTGAKSPHFKVDCRSWNVKKVTIYTNFNQGVSDKVLAPEWEN